MAKPKTSGSLSVEETRLLLDRHALPPGARKPCWRRTFTPHHRSELARLRVTAEQAERLARILPAIAYFTAKGPRLADVRAPLRKLAADADKAAKALRVMLEGDSEAMQESRLRLLQSIEALHPERCEIDPARVSFYVRYDRREPEAQRLLAALQDVAQVAHRSVKRMPSKQTRAVAHTYPVELIAAALAVDSPVVPVSASEGSKFLEVATVCYQAAGLPEPLPEPLRAIRAYLEQCNASPKK